MKRRNLPTSALEELRMLSNYHVSNRSTAQIVMLGQPEFRDRLRESPDLEQLRQRVIATHHLDPMRDDEIEPYIMHRLHQVGYVGNPAFDATAFDALYRASGGIPRIVNTLMARILLTAALEDASVVNAEMIAAVADEAREETAPPAPQAATAIVPDMALLNRVAFLEAKVSEQEMALRRVLALLVSWVEADAAGDQRSDAA